ncbi:MAG: aldehyde dehydrogenase family protein [Clostridia bacterium]
MNAQNLIKKQKELFKTGITRDIKYRIDALNRLYNAIEKYEADIMEAIYLDFSKPKEETYITEIMAVKLELKSFIKNLKKYAKTRKVSTSLINFPSSGYIVPEPRGVSLIISPWNYPVNLALTPVIGSIAAGNCTVIKLSEYVPNTNAVLKKIVDEAFAEGYVSIVEGAANETISLIDQGVDYVFFTGSTSVGKLVMAQCSKNITPVTLELGGKSPCIVDSSADIKVAAKRIVFGKYINAGQTCVAPDYILVESKVRDMLVAEIIASIKEMYYVNGELTQKFCHIIHPKAVDRLASMLDGSNILFGGKVNLERNIIEPTVTEVKDMESSVMQAEIFGPILPILAVDTVDKAVEIVQSIDKPLALYIFSKNKKNIDKVMQETSSGGVAINDTIMHIVEKNLPFGGVGSSGIGSYHGEASFNTFSHFRSVLKKSLAIDIKLRYSPHINKLVKYISKNTI